MTQAPLDLLLLPNWLVPVEPAAVVLKDHGLGIRDGKIAAVGQLPSARADVEIDAKGLHVLPGVIDSQVHFREPGLEHKEDLGTGTASAALGGITAICEMPNTKPSTTTPAAMANKVRLGREKAWTDFAFFMGAAAFSCHPKARGGPPALPGPAVAPAAQ